MGCLFALFTSAYFMRMGLSDWRAMPVPRLLWLNTGVLVLSSVALQCAVFAARKGQIDNVRNIFIRRFGFAPRAAVDHAHVEGSAAIGNRAAAAAEPEHAHGLAADAAP